MFLIHISPFLVCLVLKWYRHELENPDWTYSAHSPRAKWTEPYNIFASDGKFKFEGVKRTEHLTYGLKGLGYAVLFYIGHQVVYQLLIKVVVPLPEEGKYLTSFRYLHKRQLKPVFKRLPG